MKNDFSILCYPTFQNSILGVENGEGVLFYQAKLMDTKFNDYISTKYKPMAKVWLA